MQQLDLLFNWRLTHRRRLESVAEGLVVEPDLAIRFAERRISLVPVIDEFGNRDVLHLGVEFKSSGTHPLAVASASLIPMHQPACYHKRFRTGFDLGESLYSQLNSITTTARLECQLKVPQQRERRARVLKESPWALIALLKSWRCAPQSPPGPEMMVGGPAPN